MHVVLENPGGGQADVELRLGNAEVTVGDLLEAMPGAANGASGILLDGRFLHAELGLGEIGLYEGARIRAARRAALPDEAPVTPLEVHVIAGYDAGRRIPLTASGVVIGREPACEAVFADESLSRRHVRVDPSPGGSRATVTDLGSVNGTWVEGRRISEPTEVAPGEVFEAGDIAFVVAERTPALLIDPVREAGAAGTIAFNRPPRARRPGELAPLTAPESPTESSRPRFSVASAVGPLILGGVMVVLTNNIMFALFMLLSPVLVIGSWLEQRRAAGRTSRTGQREFQEQLAAFRTELTRRREDELVDRREALPELAEIERRACAPDPRLWERRPDHDDFLTLSAGLGELPFTTPLADRRRASAEAEAVLAELGSLPLVPVPVPLGGGGVVGIVGAREHALALARALLAQAAVLHGPADLIVGVFAQEERAGEWDWVKWLPHAHEDGGGSGRRVAADPAAGAALAAELAGRDEEDPRAVLAVFDSPAMIEGRGAPGRALLRDARVSGIVLAESAERLPAACTTVIELAPEAGDALLQRPQTGERVDPLLVAGMSAATARECARALARFEDADLQVSGGALPDFVSLFSLAALTDPLAETVAQAWRSSTSAAGLRAAFALSEDGAFPIDLVADGPHGLIAGTTGAGKSELLRSLVASLAAAHPPERVNFVLVDYKGGSAFAECAELPHTVGMVTDLDEHLGERALRSLEAELRYRERVLRDARASDLIEYDRLVAAGQVPPLPRLLVIIDEFATLAAELPDFVPSLVGIAQRGRSLGVHMILATQRPSGAVNENIRANTNLRICLRVQTPQDSSDVIDAPVAARVPRRSPGRAYVRLGPSELTPVQTALVSTATAADEATGVAIRPFRAPAGPAGANGAVFSADGPSDLQRLVAAAQAAFTGDAPRRPWLEPLPGVVPAAALLELGAPRPLAGERGLTVPIALGDDPDAQAQYPVGWNLDAGNLLLFGIGGAGTTTALRTLALSLAGASDPTRLHLYALDFGAGELGALTALPHVGAVIGAAEHERQRRLLRWLLGELRARRGLDAAARAAVPRLVVLLDGYGTFAAEHADIAGDELRGALARVWSDGPELGIHMAIAADRVGAVPMALASLAQQRLAFQLADPADYAQFGVMPRAIPRFVPGRAIVGGTGQEVQIALTGDVAAGPRPPAGGPRQIEVLPETVPVTVLLGAARAHGDPMFVPLGIGDERLAPAGFELYEGEHAIIAGPARSGRSTALLVAAAVLAHAAPDLALFAVASRRSPLGEAPGLDRVVSGGPELAELVSELKGADRPQVLLIDDADTVEDPGRALSDLLSASLPHLHVILAGRSDALRSLGHWSVGARRSRTGLLLTPDVQVDGALLGVTLPRRPEPPGRPGCGYRIDPGGFELIQVATV